MSGLFFSGMESLADARGYYYDSQDINESVYFGSAAIAMIYGFIIEPMWWGITVFFFTSKDAFNDLSKKAIYFSIFFMVVSSLLVGGRFVVYMLAMAYVFGKGVVKKGKINEVYGLKWIALLFVLATVVKIFRDNNLEFGLVNNLVKSIASVFEYHIIGAFVVNGLLDSSPTSWGPFTWLQTILYRIANASTAEGELGDFLRFNLVPGLGGDLYNAFGTSLILFGGWNLTIAIIVFWFILCFWLFFASFVLNCSIKWLALFSFIIYFSAFQPYAYAVQSVATIFGFFVAIYMNAWVK